MNVIFMMHRVSNNKPENNHPSSMACIFRVFAQKLKIKNI